MDGNSQYHASILETEAGSGYSNEVVRKWFQYAEMQVRFIDSLSKETEQVSGLVEESAIGMSAQFRELGNMALMQSEDISEIIENITQVEMDDRVFSYEEIIHDMDKILDHMVSSIIHFSKEAMNMVFRLKHVVDDVVSMEKALKSIDNINRQTQYLSINAAIEAQRAGGKTGESFNVVADELREMSKDTAVLAEIVRERMSSVSGGIKDTHDILQRIAETDLSQQVDAKEKIDKAMQAIVGRIDTQKDVMTDALGTSKDIARLVSEMTMTMQFQDYSKQKLQHVMEGMAFIVEGLTILQNETQGDGEALEKIVPPELVESFLNQCTLGEVKQSLIRRILLEEDEKDDATDAEKKRDSTSEGTIELF